MQLEPVKPAHGSLATLSQLGKHLMIMDAMVITHYQGSGVDEGDPMTASVQALQVSTQWPENRRHQDPKSFVADQFRELTSQVLTDVICVIGFEVSIVRLMKMNQDRHHLADTQLPCAAASFAAILHQFSLPERQKDLAKIIYTDKQFE